MSILLEALKKSEAQRQLGKTPTLQTASSGEELSAQGKHILIPATMLLLAAVVIGWIGVAQFHRPEPVVAVAVPTPDMNLYEATTEVPKPEGRELKSATNPVKDFALASPPPESAAEQDSRSADSAEKEAASQANQIKSFTVGESRVALSETATESAHLTKRDTSPVTGNQGRPERAQQNGSDRLEPFVAEPISFWQLPQSLRENLPEMHITVLVYAEKSEDRFLLIDGDRVRESDDIGNGLMLEEIQRDRAIFSFRSYRFHVKG